MKTPVAKVALRKLTIVYLVATVSMINARRIHVRPLYVAGVDYTTTNTSTISNKYCLASQHFLFIMMVGVRVCKGKFR